MPTERAQHKETFGSPRGEKSWPPELALTSPKQPANPLGSPITANITVLFQDFPLSSHPDWFHLFERKKERKKHLFQRFEFCLMNKGKAMLSPPSRTFPLNSDKRHRTAGSEVCEPYKIEKAFFHPLKSYGYSLTYKSILNESLQYGKLFSHESSRIN